MREPAPTRCPGRLIVLLTLLVLAAGPAGAQPPSPPPQPPAPPVGDLSIQDLMGLEVQSVFGASKFLQKITDAPASVTVVTAEDIEAFGYRSLSDVLRTVRGFYGTYDRVYDFPGVRGFQRPGDYNTRFLLLIDGVRANDNVYEQAPMGDEFPVDIDLIERIEVIRGASSSLYGSNAFFGVVNVVTRTARDMPGRSASADVGSLGHWGARVRTAHVFSNGSEVLLGASYTRRDGQARLYFPELDSATTSDGIAEGLDWQRVGRVFASLVVGNLSLQAAASRREKGIPTAAYGIIFNDARSQVTDNLGFVNGRYHLEAGRFQVRATASLGWMVYTGDLPYQAEAPDEGTDLLDENGTGLWMSGDVMVSGTVAGGHRVSAGVDVRRNVRADMVTLDGRGRAVIDLASPSTNWAWYAQDEFRLTPRHMVSLGLRHDAYPTFDAPVTPRAAWIYTPTEKTAIKAMYGRAFRAPSVYERDYEQEPYRANPELEPERMRTGEIAIEQYIGLRYRASVNVFHYRVTDLIVQTADDEDATFSYQNIASASATGVELEAEGKWPGGYSARVSLSAQNTRDGDTNERVINSPVHVGQATVTFPVGTPRVLAALTAHAVGSRYTKAGGSVAGYVSPAMTLRAAGLFRRLDLSLSVFNALDRRYADPASDEMPQDTLTQDGRTALLRATVRF